ncbi:Oidioi.mRNA.OKI2018_I69.chr2.g7093.t1.cds [Oikopleura dioica]|uniref:Oidioi.mRNA.OKI2018_I69.chr2.g7093.t1.cds n=1 Tax=Oikopleura dioica TaxID=34765 RepID=A0ABN7T614_OIKDI|nr:Oidioi.mRNA.OKI2018_I69.chr2.g7093.t1.cds [Oikopleura dioica]
MDMLFGVILVAKPGGCVWKVEGICEVPVVRKNAIANIKASFPSNTTTAECEAKVLSAINSSSPNANANVTCSEASLRKRKSLNPSPIVRFDVDIELTITMVVDTDEENSDNDTESDTTDTAVSRINMTTVDVEEVVKEVPQAEEESDISQFEGKYFTPQACNATLQNDTYRVIYETKIFISSTGKINDIIDAFEPDLIDGHSLCVEFSDIYDILYITIDSASQEGNFYTVGVEIEQEVEKEIGEILESLAISGVVVYPDSKKTLVTMLLAEGVNFDLSVIVEFENDWTWSSELLDKTSSSYALLTSVINNIFSSSWDAIATDNNLDLDVRIRYSKNRVSRRRRSATASTIVNIILDYKKTENNTNINSPSDLQTLEASIMAELQTALATDAEQNDATNFLSNNFEPSINCELMVSFDSVVDQEISTTVLPTTIYVNTVQNERIVAIEEAVDDMEGNLENLSLVDIKLTEEISDLSDHITNVEKSAEKKERDYYSYSFSE